MQIFGDLWCWTAIAVDESCRSIEVCLIFWWILSSTEGMGPLGFLWQFVVHKMLNFIRIIERTLIFEKWLDSPKATHLLIIKDLNRFVIFVEDYGLIWVSKIVEDACIFIIRIMPIWIGWLTERFIRYDF